MSKSHGKDFFAFQQRLKGSTAFSYETRDDAETLEAPAASEVKKALDKLTQTVNAGQEKNEERLKELEKRGSTDPLTEEALARIMKSVEEQKEVRDQLDEMSKRVGRLRVREETKNDGTEAELSHKTAFKKWIKDPTGADARRDLKAANDAWIQERAQEMVREGLDEFEVRTVLTGTDAAGGYAVPEVIARQIQRELTEIADLSGLVHTINVGSPEYKEMVDIGGATFGWGNEGSSITNTGTPSLEAISPTFGKLWAYPKISEESINDIFFNVDAWVIDSVVEAFDAGIESAIINGDGSNKPTGLLQGTPTTQKDGVRPFGTLQYAKTGKAGGFADAPDGFDAFRSLTYQLKKGYRRNARWLMNKATAGEAMLLKNSDGDYVWQTSVLLGQPDTLMGYPVSESEEMPDIADNAFPIAFGDFKAAYLLALLVGLRMNIDDITEPGMRKYYVRRRLGGCKRKSEAAKLLSTRA